MDEENVSDKGKGRKWYKETFHNSKEIHESSTVFLSHLIMLSQSFFHYYGKCISFDK